jgi:hypothetical protein
MAAAASLAASVIDAAAFRARCVKSPNAAFASSPMGLPPGRVVFGILLLLYTGCAVVSVTCSEVPGPPSAEAICGMANCGSAWLHGPDREFLFLDPWHMTLGEIA